VIESCTFNQFNLRLISFESIFSTIEIDFINDLVKYQLLTSKKITKDIKKLLYHHIFHGTCEYLLSLKSKERIVILKSIQLDLSSTRIIQYFDKQQIEKYVDKAALQLAKLLPISIYGYENIDFNLINHLYTKRNGDVVELIERIRNFAWEKSFIRSYYTFARVKNFVKRNELTFLSEKYFEQLKTKQLIYV
jgi:hypothetical protein